MFQSWAEPMCCTNLSLLRVPARTQPRAVRWCNTTWRPRLSDRMVCRWSSTAQFTPCFTASSPSMPSPRLVPPRFATVRCLLCLVRRHQPRSRAKPVHALAGSHVSDAVCSDALTSANDGPNIGCVCRRQASSRCEFRRSGGCLPHSAWYSACLTLPRQPAPHYSRTCCLCRPGLFLIREEPVCDLRNLSQHVQSQPRGDGMSNVSYVRDVCMCSTASLTLAETHTRVVLFCQMEVHCASVLRRRNARAARTDHSDNGGAHNATQTGVRTTQTGAWQQQF